MEFKKAVVGLLETNVYLISSGKDGIIVDPGAETDRILALAAGISIRCILLTHNHPDHTQALKPVKDSLGVKCGIHPLDRTESVFDFEINDGDEIKFGSSSLKVIHTPGHTPGSCCFLVEHLLFSGDTVFLGGYGRTDIGGNETDILNSVKKITSLPFNTQVYPGHGQPTTVGDIQEFINEV